MSTSILIGLFIGLIMAALDVVSFKATKKLGAWMGIMVWILMASIGLVAFQFSLETGVSAVIFSIVVAALVLFVPKNPYELIANKCDTACNCC